MKNILLKGGPGTGKTLTARAISYYVGKEGLDINDVYQKDFWMDRNKIESYVQSDFVEYIQIHPSMTYEDIVYGIDVKLNGSLTMTYAEKRIKQICDRATGMQELFFVILDDIGRTNSGRLLGNLLYALEYRNEPVTLTDGNELTIPENVCFIITECRTLYGIPLEYAIRRRFDYEKELSSNSVILDGYYNTVLTARIKKAVLDAFETIKNFITGHILLDSSIEVENYIPGHGMMIVDKSGNAQDILTRIQSKFEYQLWPYINELKMAGTITARDDELANLYNNIINQLNSGQTPINNTTTVQKIFVKSQNPVSVFSLADSMNYYQNTIIPCGCKEHRAIIENIADAIFLNGVLTPDKALAAVFLNTNVVQFEHRTLPGNYAAFMVEESQCDNYWYQTTNSNSHRSYYSKNNCKTGRWKGKSDAPAYRVTFSNGTIKTYISLNAFRNVGFSPTSKVIHAEENTASIYCALYYLVRAYLQTYEKDVSLLAATNPSYADLCNLVSFERSYWELKQNAVQQISGADKKLEELTSACLNLRTLWNQVGTPIVVDATKFSNLINRTSQISVINYEELYNITGATKTIVIQGVNTMVNLNDYQQIMDSIGIRQMIFQGPPGTSKTFESKKFVLKQLNPASTVLASPNPSQEQISTELESYKLSATDYATPNTSSKMTTGGWDLVQFHPSYGYEDFIRGIEVKPIHGQPTYEAVNRILGKIAEFAKIAENAVAKGSPVPKFYLIIDEINRANLATVFGELIYGLEYRNSKVSTPYEVNDRVINAYSKDIVLGKNLYIIGTMNTADKSIDAIDYAIRRRFIFVDSPARRDVVKKCYQGTMNVQDENSIELFLFDSVGMVFDDNRFFNEEYQKNDVKIGHTYFLRNTATNYVDAIAEKFVFQVVPILREYVKDGILDSYEDKSDLEHTVQEIATLAISSLEKAEEMFAEEIMLFIKHFGEKDSANMVIDNQYIANYIESLCTQMGY